MTYEIATRVVAARALAAVHREVPAGRASAYWKPALDRVWALLRRREGPRTEGHNIFVYHHPASNGVPMEVDFGVEVSDAFEAEDGVDLAHTPSGRVATTRHVGPYDQIGHAHAAIEAWCRAQGLPLGGVSWEIYGDAGDDPATNEVQVFYLLA